MKLELKNKIKEELTQAAITIKGYKVLRKPKNRTEEVFSQLSQWDVMCSLYTQRREYRHKHIAYCEFFNNTPYEQIEKPRVGNKANRPRIDKFKKEWTDQLDWDGQISEAIRNCA